MESTFLVEKMSKLSCWSIFLLVIFATSTVEAASKLIYADVLWRHGTRAPDHLYKTSLNEPSDFPPGLGELVPQGVIDHIKLGKKLKRQFVDETGLISPTYIAKEVKVISTISDRTIASAQANFVGFYGFSTTGSDIPTFTPVPVYPENAIWMNWTLCRSQQEFTQLILKSDVYASFHANFTKLRSTLSQNSGTDVTDNDHVASGICDAIKFELINHKPIPMWAALIQQQCDQFRKRYYELLLGFVDYAYLGTSVSSIAQKIFSSITFDVLDRLQHQYDVYHETNNTDLKYHASSVHDIHLSLLSLGFEFRRLSFTEDRWIGLAEAVSFELWTSDDNVDGNTIKMWFYPNNQENPIELTQFITECKGSPSGCSIQKIIKNTAAYRIENFDQFCTESLETVINSLKQ